MNTKIVGVLVVVLALLVGFLVLSRTTNVFGGPGQAEYMHKTFLQGLGVGQRNAFNVSNTGALTGTTATFSGAVTISGAANYLAKVTAITATTTVTAAQSGTVFSISGDTADITLPAVSNAGATYTFVIGGAIDGNNTITSAAGDDIEGSVIVAGAVVDCNAADVLTFVADGENIGDFVTLVSNGTNWIPLASGALTAAKLTCSG